MNNINVHICFLNCNVRSSILTWRSIIKLYTPKEWAERFRHYVKGIHDVDKQITEKHSQQGNNGETTDLIEDATDNWWDSLHLGTQRDTERREQREERRLAEKKRDQPRNERGQFTSSGKTAKKPVGLEVSMGPDEEINCYNNSDGKPVHTNVEDEVQLHVR